jgi:endonuclease-3 related protein
MRPTARQLFERLYEAFGPQSWWPAHSAFEVMVGAILVQNTAWKNVERAIDNLRTAGALHPHALRNIPQTELEQLVKPSGYYRIKAARLRHFVDFLFSRFDGSLSRMFSTEMEQLRRELLQVHGIGPETADSILLYAGNMPVFVVDSYTRRVLARHGWIGFDAPYHQVQDYFAAQLDQDAELYNEYHALLVRVGHLHCRRLPRCESCPLKEWLPPRGALSPC